MTRTPVLVVLAAASLFAGGQARPTTAITVRVSTASDKPYVPRAAATLRAALAELAAVGLTGPSCLVIRAASSPADFVGRTGLDVRTAAVTTRRNACPVIATQRLGVLAATGRLTAVLRHEAFHAVQPPGLPLWLAEGLARIFAGERDPAGRAGLQGISNDDLDRLLTHAASPDAYQEATRRANALLTKSGWVGALARVKPALRLPPTIP